MVTKEQAITETEFHVLEGRKNADGTPQRWRANGKCKTWKTRPNDFRLPIKHGLRDHGYLDQDNAYLFGVGDGR